MGVPKIRCPFLWVVILRVKQVLWGRRRSHFWNPHAEKRLIYCPCNFEIRDPNHQEACSLNADFYIWVVVKIMVHFWIPIIIRHLIFRVPKKVPLILGNYHMCAQPETPFTKCFFPRHFLPWPYCCARPQGLRTHRWRAKPCQLSV